MTEAAALRCVANRPTSRVKRNNRQGKIRNNGISAFHSSLNLCTVSELELLLVYYCKERRYGNGNGILFKSLNMLPYLMTGIASRLLLSALALILLLASNVNGESDSRSIVQTFPSINAFQSTVISSKSVWLIRFFDGSDSSSNDNGSFVYEEVANVLSGVVQVGAIDVSVPQQREIADALNLKSFPKVFVLGDDKLNPVEHKGKMEPQELLQSAVSAIGKVVETRARKRWVVQDEQQQQQPGAGGGSSKRRQQQANAGGTVVELTERNFQRKVLDNPDVGGVAFIAPWCGHCKQLLPEWHEAARLLEGEAYLGVVDATVETGLASQYQVQGYPTIKIFPGGKDKKPSDAIDYEGGRTKEDIVRAILKEVDTSGVPKEIPEFTGRDSMLQCEGTNKICLLAALPPIHDSSADKRNQYRDVLTKISKKYRGAAFQIQWFEGSSQPDLEEVLDFTFGYPAVAAISLDKGVYSVMHASFTEKSISLFLTGITTGRQTTNPLRREPNIVETTAWDGKDAPAIEEEFSLEDIMGDDDEVADDDQGEEL